MALDDLLAEGASRLRAFSADYRALYEHPDSRPGADELFALAGRFGAVLQALLREPEHLRRPPGDDAWHPGQMLVSLEQAMCSVILLASGDEDELAITPETYDSALDDPFIARFLDPSG
jgi:hypothetical protein